jgi:hypothetical protein
MADTTRIEYRVVWRRQGQAQNRAAIYQTRDGAIRCAERQASARDEMEWVDPPLPPVVVGPVIEQREVTPWAPSPANEEVRQ